MLEIYPLIVGAALAASYLLAGITLGLWLDTKIPNAVERLFFNRVSIALALWLVWPGVIVYVLISHWISRLVRRPSLHRL